MDRFLQAVAAEKGTDLEAWEEALRQALLVAGARVLERVVDGIGRGRPSEPIRCACGQRMRSVGVRTKTLCTSLGPIRFRRSLFVCGGCGKSRFPGDERLGVVGTRYSPGAQRLLARAGSRTAFAEAAEDLRVYAGLEASPKEIERVAEAVGRASEQWQAREGIAVREAKPNAAPPPSEPPIPTFYVSFDGTGIPMRAEELAGRAGRQPDGSARTREVKLGCVFTQVGTDEEGHPVRDDDSTSYVGAIESSALFGWRLYAEAVRRGLARARQVIGLTDGARYNQSILRMHFARATPIIDLYHAREHLHELCALRWGPDAPLRRKQPWLERLEAGEIESLVRAVEQELPGRGGSRWRKRCRTFGTTRRRCATGGFGRRGCLWVRGSSKRGVGP